MVNFLSATERERLANISYAIQIVVNVGATLGLARVVGMDAPWYGAMIANLCSCAFLLFAGRMSKGFVKRYPENALVLTGGQTDANVVEEWHKDTVKVLGEDKTASVWEKVIEPFLASDNNKPEQLCTYSVIQRENGDTAAILRYGGKTDLKHLIIGEEADEEEDEEELSHVYDQCVSSEFNTLRRMMINFKA